MFVHQRREFMAHMREALGLRPDRKVKSLSDLAVSAGRGPKTKAQADRRDAALVRRHEAECRYAEVGMDVGGHGRPGSVADNVHAHPKTPTSLLRSNSHVDALWADLFENRKKAPKIAAVEPDEKALPPAAARCLELADEDHGPDVSNAADVTKVESVTTPWQRMTRDDDRPAGTWSAELGEFVELPTTTKRTGRQEADAWVAAALRARGQDDRKPVTA